MPSRIAFTLIELLIVIAVIVGLAGLTFIVGNRVVDAAKVTRTSQRIQAVITGLGQLGSASAAYAIQDQVLRISTTTGQSGKVNWSNPQPYTTWEYCYVSPFFQVDATRKTGPTSSPGSVAYLSEFQSRKTVELLVASGVCDTDDDVSGVAYAGVPTYLSSHPYKNGALRVKHLRGARYPWNDAWGNPLIVAYALFETNSAADLAAYGYNRCVYISVGALGSVRSAASNQALAVPFTNLNDLSNAWTRINAVANVDASNKEMWTSAATSPPWNGIRSAIGDGSSYIGTAMLSAPAEYR